MDTLPMPVTSLGLQRLGDKRSFSCLCATASLGRQEEPFAAGKPRFTSRGMLVYPFGNTQATTRPQRGFTAVQQVCLPLPRPH